MSEGGIYTHGIAKNLNRKEATQTKESHKDGRNLLLLSNYRLSFESFHHEK